MPPFADAHSHSFGQGIPGADSALAPATRGRGVLRSEPGQFADDPQREPRSGSTPGGVDVAFSNATLTSHNSALHAFFSSMILPRGIFGLHARDVEQRPLFRDRHRRRIEAKWPSIVAQKDHFIKTYLWLTDDAPFTGRRR